MPPHRPKPSREAPGHRIGERVVVRRASQFRTFTTTATGLGHARLSIIDLTTGDRAPNTVWPTGNYFKGGVYGPDMNLPPSQAERNNPDYTGCANRDA